jgi:hydrogenase maturation protease
MKTLVAGIGSTIRGDDGVGVRAARQLKARLPNGRFDVIELGTAGLTLLDSVEGYDRLILLDAIVTGAPPGTVHELTGKQIAASAHLGTGHEADLPTTLALGRKLSKYMPADVIVLAVEAGDLNGFSEDLTPEVGAAIPEVLARVMELVEVAEITSNQSPVTRDRYSSRLVTGNG